MSLTLILEHVLLFSCQDLERKHRTVVATYRSHLLAAVQVSFTLMETAGHANRTQDFDHTLIFYDGIIITQQI